MGCCGGCKCRAKEHRIRQIGPVDEPMASQTQGIQQLLIAEKKAAEKVSEARKRKARRIKQAREEAQADIEKYRQERERVFKEYEDKQLGNREGVAARIDHDTQDFLDKMNKELKNNREKVVEELIALVINVQPEVHPNYFVVNPRKTNPKT